MSTNQRIRLFIAIRDLERQLKRKDADESAILASVGSLRFEMKAARRAARTGEVI